MTMSALSMSEDVAGSSYTTTSNGRVISMTINIQQSEPDTLDIDQVKPVTLTIDQSDLETI